MCDVLRAQLSWEQNCYFVNLEYRVPGSGYVLYLRVFLLVLVDVDMSHGSIFVTRMPRFFRFLLSLELRQKTDHTKKPTSVHVFCVSYCPSHLEQVAGPGAGVPRERSLSGEPSTPNRMWLHTKRCFETFCGILLLLVHYSTFKDSAWQQFNGRWYAEKQRALCGFNKNTLAVLHWRRLAFRMLWPCKPCVTVNNKHWMRLLITLENIVYFKIK